MEVLNEEQMLSINGGFKLTMSFIAIASSIVTFALGVIDGLSNPKVCNSGKR
jgi:hypothetical protein